MMKYPAVFSLLSIILLVNLSSAWPWHGSFEKMEGLVLRRQDSSSSAPSGSEKTSGTVSKTDASSVRETSTNKASASGSGAAATTGAARSDSAATTEAPNSQQSSHSNSTSKATKGSKTTAIDPRLPAGGIEMVTPAVLAGPQYYKIGDYVTFAWNYTSLSVTPTAIDIMASCSKNSELYTIAMNQTVQPTGAVTWDTGNYQSTATVPLLTETYTLIIYDAAKDVSTAPSAGYLQVFNQYTFGMYTPQPYTPLNEFKCATCSAALSNHERQALGLLVGMGAITILSFSWFAGAFGVFS